MECYNCRNLYNETDRSPRLLINCGHSICEKCTAELYRDNMIVCPECKYKNTVPSITCFPRNLALIHLKKRSESPALSRQNSQEHPTTICQKHQKKFEAFCSKDRELLCITCILEDGHRQHQVDSLDNATKREQELMNKAYEQCKMGESRLLGMLGEIVQNLNALTEAGEKQLVDITKFYNEIRRIVNDRESTVKQKVKDIMLKEEKNLNQKEANLQMHLNSINDYVRQFTLAQNQESCEFLSLTTAREELQKKALENFDSIDFSIPFSELNRENEINVLIKQILNQKISDQQHKRGKSKITQQQQISNTVAGGGNFLKSAISTANISSKECKDTSVGNNNNNNQQQSKKAYLKNPNTREYNQKQKSSSTVPQNVLNNTKKTNDLLKEPQIAVAQTTSGGNGQGVQILNSNYMNQGKQQVIGPVTLHFNLAQNMNANKNQLQQNSENVILNQQQTLQTTPQPMPAQNDLLKKNDIKRSNSPLNNTSNNILRKPLNNYHEIRNILKEKLNNERQIVDKNMNDSIGRIELQKEDMSANELTPIRKSSSRDNLKVSHRSPASMVILNNKFYHDNSENTDQNLFESIKNIGNSNINLDNTKFTTQNKNINDEFDFSAILNPDKNQKEESIQGELNTFLHESSNKFNTDLTDLCMNKCDFSTLYQQQQLNQYIYVIGGFIESPRYAIERFDLQKNVWEEVDYLRNNRAKFAVAALNNGNMLIMGGKQEGMRVALCEEYSPKEGKIKISENIMLTSPKSGFGVAVKNDVIYVVGGNDGTNILNTFEMYDYKKKSVVQLPPLRERRDELAVTFGPDNKIYAIGGFGGQSNVCLKSAERYNQILEKWEPIGQLNVSRRALTAVTLPDGIYAIGGFDGYNYLSSVEKYDEQLNEWIFVCSMNYPRCTLSSITSPDCQNIYVFGGFDNGPLQSVEKYSVVNDSWEIIQPMKHKRFMHACVLITK